MEIKCQLDATDGFFIADLIACSICFGHHYAHHQELKSIIQVVAACGIWCFGFKLPVWCRAVGCVSGLRDAADWRKLHNEERNDLYSSPNNVRVIKSTRMELVGHVACMGKRRGE